MFTKAFFVLTVFVAINPALAQGRRGGGTQGGGAGSAVRIPPNATFVEPLVRWEYARLDIYANSAAGQGVFKVTWHGPGAMKFDAAGVLDLVQKLAAADVVATTAPTQIDDDLLLWNMLGDKGWDFISQETIESPTDSNSKTRQTVVRFKRPKR